MILRIVVYFVVACTVATFSLRGIRANNLIGFPDDMPHLNATQVFIDAFHTSDIMRSDTYSEDLQEYIRKMFMMNFRLYIVDTTTMHRYDNPNDKLISGGPKANAKECRRKLKYLITRANLQQSNNKSLVESKDFLLFNLLDSYGRPGTGFVRGNIHWFGEYNQCLEAKYNYDATNSDHLTGSRYCLAHLRWPKWKTTQGFKEWTYATVKSGICLPDACDSTSAEHNKDLIKELMNYVFPSAYRRYQIGSIYCLPDAESSLTQWTKNIPATCCVVFLVLWFIVAIGATLLDFMRIPNDEEVHDGGGGRIKIYIEIWALRKNYNRLFRKTSPQDQTDSTVVTYDDREENGINMPNKSLVESELNKCRTFKLKTGARIENKKKRINLTFLHSIKVMGLFFVMKSHPSALATSVYTLYTLNNVFNTVWYWSTPLAGFCVNIFLIITGLLTSYILFNHNFNQQDNKVKQGEKKTNSKSKYKPDKSSSKSNRTPIVHQYQSPPQPNLLTKPSIWLAITLKRYLRIVPLWAIVTMIVKYLGKFLSHGPMWDYGVSNGTNGYMCSQQSWASVFLATANLVTPYQSCVSSGWYLAMDLKFTILIAPVVIVALVKAPRMTLLASLSSPFLYIIYFALYETFPPLLVTMIEKYGIRNLANGIYIIHEFAPIYLSMVMRGGFFLTGLATGYMLHIYENHNNLANNNNSGQQHNATNKIIVNIIEFLRLPIFSNWLFVVGVFISLTIPFWLHRLYEIHMTYFFFYISTADIVFMISYLGQAFIVPITFIQIATGSLNAGKFLLWPGWLPLSRMSLSYLLVDPVFIFIFNASLVQNIRLTPWVYLNISLAQSVMIHILSLMVYLLFESPIETLIHHALLSLGSKDMISKKTSNSKLKQQ